MQIFSLAIARGSIANSPTQVRKMWVCKFWLQGECKRGSSCAYQHRKPILTKENIEKSSVQMQEPEHTLLPLPSLAQVPLHPLEDLTTNRGWPWGFDAEESHGDDEGSYFYGAAGTKFEARGNRNSFGRAEFQ